MIKRLIYLLITLIVAMGICGCMEHNIGEKQTSAVNEDAGKIKITDMLGREVEVPKDIRTICPLKWGSTRIIVYLNASDKIVGISEFEKNKGMDVLPYLIAHPEFKNLSIIQTGMSPNVEEIVKLKPDVIIASYYTIEEADKLQKQTGIPVVVIKPGLGAKEYINYSDNNNDFYKSLRLVAKILHKEDRAEEVIKYIKNTVKDLNERTKDIPDDKKPKVYIGGLSKHGSFGITSTQIKYPPFILVNAKNVASEINSKSNTVQVSKERLIAWNPDVIFIDEVNLNLVIKDLKKPEYKQITAVKNGEIYGVFPYPRYGLNHEIVLANAYYVGKVLYPDKFKDINPEEKADEIFAFFVGKPVYNTMKERLGGYKKLEINN